MSDTKTSHAWRVQTQRDFDVVEREFGATRVLGTPHRGPLSFAGLSEVCRALEGAVRGSGVRAAGPILTVLSSNPWEIAPSRRHYFTCVPVVGSVTPPDGLAVQPLHGGLFVVTICQGPLRVVEEAFGFLFGRFLASRGQELARAEEPQIRLVYPRAPHDVTREADLVTQIALPVSITMRTDSMRNQK